MKNYLQRIIKLEERINLNKDPIMRLFNQKESEDKYYLGKFMKCLDKRELEQLIEILDKNEPNSLQFVEHLINKYGKKIRNVALSSNEINRFEEVNARINLLNDPDKTEIFKRGSEFAKKFWDDIFNKYPITND